MLEAKKFELSLEINDDSVPSPTTAAVAVVARKFRTFSAPIHASVPPIFRMYSNGMCGRSDGSEERKYHDLDKLSECVDATSASSCVWRGRN